MDGACPHCTAPFEVAPDRPATTCPSCLREFEVYVPRRARAPRGPAVVAAPLEAGAARCARHPNNAGPEVCARCGSFMCRVCATPLEGRVICVACAERVIGRREFKGAGGAFTYPRSALAAGIGALLLAITGFLGIILSVVAVVYGILALQRISAEPNLPGRGKAIAGIVLGVVAGIASFVPFIMAIFFGK